jgi:hypothetical protein
MGRVELARPAFSCPGLRSIAPVDLATGKAASLATGGPAEIRGPGKATPEHIKASWPGSSWIVELITTSGTRKGQRAPRVLHLLTSLRTTPKALLRTAAMNLLCRGGFRSIREGLQPPVHYISGMLALPGSIHAAGSG